MKLAQPHGWANMLRNIQYIYTQRHARECSITPQVHTLGSSLIHRRHAQVTLQRPKTHIQRHSYAHGDTLKCTLQSTHPETNTRKHTYTKIRPRMQSHTETRTLRNMCVYRCTKSLHCNTHRCTPTEAHEYRATQSNVPSNTHIHTPRKSHIFTETLTVVIPRQTHTHTQRVYAILNIHTHRDTQKSTLKTM